MPSLQSLGTIIEEKAGVRRFSGLFCARGLKMIKLQMAESGVVQEYGLQQFCEAMGVAYTRELLFFSEEIREDVRARCQRALEKREFSIKQKWLGIYYAQEILTGRESDLLIAWVDDRLGYGVIANRDIPTGAYIGEYTGVVRKRKFWADRSNDYCFDYAVGGVQRSPYVIDARDKGNASRFVNHSSSPNVETGAVYCDGAMHIILYALTPIPKGAQLFYDYGEEYWKKRDDLLPYQPT
jgi:hypothetical protein